MTAQRSAPVRSRTGTISVVATEQGLPTALKIDASELRKPPKALAAEIFALCRLSAMRQQVERRRGLADNPYGVEICRNLGLATEDELTAAQEELMGDDDDAPATWMRSV